MVRRCLFNVSLVSDCFLDASAWGNGLAPIAVHNLTSTIILPSSHPSSLLVYSPTSGTPISELEISPSNRISRIDGDKPIEPSRVQRACITPDGLWLATIDTREGGGEFGRECYLKIWKWDGETAQWGLNSRIDRPHGGGGVKVLSVVGSLFVTCGEDGVRMWRLREGRTGKGDVEGTFALMCR